MDGLVFLVPTAELCVTGHRDVTQILIEAKANIEVSSHTGWHPLHVAVLKGHT